VRILPGLTQYSQPTPRDKFKVIPGPTMPSTLHLTPETIAQSLISQSNANPGLDPEHSLMLHHNHDKLNKIEFLSLPIRGLKGYFLDLAFFVNTTTFALVFFLDTAFATAPFGAKTLPVAEYGATVSRFEPRDFATLPPALTIPPML